MVKLVASLRKIFIHELNNQLYTDTGMSTRISLYTVEVQLLKAFVYLITGRHIQENEPDGLHDACCDFIENMHVEFDC